MKKPASIFWLKGRAFPALALEHFDLHGETDHHALARLDQRLRRSVARRVLEPVRVVSDTSQRQVIVLGVEQFYGYTRWPDEPIGYSFREIRTPNGETSALIGENLCFHGSVLKPIDFDELSRTMARLWMPAARRCVLRVPDEELNWALCQIEWFLYRRFAQLLGSVFRLGMLNRHAGRCLGLDGRTLGLAKTLACPRADVSHSLYLHAAWHRDFLERVRRDQSSLLWLAGILAHAAGTDTGREPVAALRHALVSRGLSPQGWRLLCRDSEGPRRLVREPWLWDHDPAKPLIAGVELHIRLGLHRAVPKEFAAAIDLDLCDYPAASLATNRIPEPLLRIVAREAMRVEASGQIVAWLNGPWDRFTEWQAAHPDLVPDSNQVRAGWPWLQQKIGAWFDAVERGRITSPLRWNFPARDISSESFVAVALERPGDLWEEGKAMSHCVGDMGHRADDGKSLFYSIRERDSGRRIATLEIARADSSASWQVCCCFGRRNEIPANAVRGFSWQVANACNRALGLPETAPAEPSPVPYAAANDGLFATLFGSLAGEDRLAA